MEMQLLIKGRGHPMGLGGRAELRRNVVIGSGLGAFLDQRCFSLLGARHPAGLF